MEAYGIEELWLVEDCFQYGGVSAATAVLGATTNLRVGVGLFPAAVRNVAIFSMELATIAALHPGRLTVALGHGVEAWMRQINARPSDRLRALAEVLVATRRLLAGEIVTMDGQFVHLTGVRLEQPPDIRPPLLIGSTGPRGITLAAEESDGLLLPEGASPAAVQWGSSHLGAEQRLVVYCWLCMDEDEQRAAATLRPMIARWGDLQLYPSLSEFVTCAENRRPVAASVALMGSVVTCAVHGRALVDAGADAIVLVPIGADPSGQIARFLTEVVPLIA